MRALAELQGDSQDQREARRKKEADFRRLPDEQRRRDERRKKKEADEKRKLDEKDAAELLAAQRKYHAETVKKSGVRRVQLPQDEKPEDDAEPGPPPAEPDDEKEATFRDRDKLPRTRGAPKPWTRGAPRAASDGELEDSGGLEPAIPGIGRGSRGSRPSTYDNYSDDNRQPTPPRKRSTHDSTADLEGMYREMLREQRSWRWVPQVPSAASVVLVQDQTSAQAGLMSHTNASLSSSTVAPPMPSVPRYHRMVYSTPSRPRRSRAVSDARSTRSHVVSNLKWLWRPTGRDSATQASRACCTTSSTSL